MSTAEETPIIPPTSSTPVDLPDSSSRLNATDQDILHVSDVYYQMVDCLEDPMLAKHLQLDDVSHIEKLINELKKKDLPPHGNQGS